MNNTLQREERVGQQRGLDKVLGGIADEQTSKQL